MGKERITGLAKGVTIASIAAAGSLACSVTDRLRINFNFVFGEESKEPTGEACPSAQEETPNPCLPTFTPTPTPEECICPSPTPTFTPTRTPTPTSTRERVPILTPTETEERVHPTKTPTPRPPTGTPTPYIPTPVPTNEDDKEDIIPTATPG